MNARENLERTIRRDNPEWVPLRYDGSLCFLASKHICVRPSQGGTDDWGVNWIRSTDEEGSYSDGKPLITIDHVDDLKVPDTDFKAVTDDMSSQLKALEGQDTLPIAYDELLIFERAQFLLGFEAFMISIKEEPEAFDRLIEKIFQYNLKFVQALLDADVPGIRFTDDWGMQNTLFISPDDWRRFFKKRYQVLYNMVKTQGKYVFVHSCGCIEPIIEDIVELGVQVLDPCQPGSNDIFMFKHKYGDKLSFMGGLDTQTWLSFGTPREVYEKTIGILRVMSKGGGYIAAPSHTITIPNENREAMFRAVSDYNDRKAR